MKSKPTLPIRKTQDKQGKKEFCEAKCPCEKCHDGKHKRLCKFCTNEEWKSKPEADWEKDFRKNIAFTQPKPYGGEMKDKHQKVRLYHIFNIDVGDYGEPFSECDYHFENTKLSPNLMVSKMANDSLSPCNQCESEHYL